MHDTHTRTATEIAATLARGAATKDLELFREALSPDAVWWHAIGNRDSTVDESLAYFQMVLDACESLSYEDVRVGETPTGYVDQHTVRATLKDGQVVNIPAVMVVTLSGGLITRLDEYLEAIAASPIAAAMEQQQ